METLLETLVVLIPLLAVLAIGVVSPGPSFVLVARTAVAISRRAAMASAIGMAAGACLLAMAALFGLHALLQQIPAAYLALKVAGGLYLLYLAWKTWRGARQPIAVDASVQSTQGGGLRRHFWLAAGTMLSNPKAAVQYGVVFAAMLPQQPTLALTLAIPPAVFMLEAAWYLFVACALSATRPRDTYLKAKTAIDRGVGAVLGLLGLRLLFTSK